MDVVFVAWDVAWRFVRVLCGRGPGINPDADVDADTAFADTKAASLSRASASAHDTAAVTGSAVPRRPSDRERDDEVTGQSPPDPEAVVASPTATNADAGAAAVASAPAAAERRRERAAPPTEDTEGAGEADAEAGAANGDADAAAVERETPPGPPAGGGDNAADDDGEAVDKDHGETADRVIPTHDTADPTDADADASAKAKADAVDEAAAGAVPTLTANDDVAADDGEGDGEGEGEGEGDGRDEGKGEAADTTGDDGGRGPRRRAHRKGKRVDKSKQKKQRKADSAKARNDDAAANKPQRSAGNAAAAAANDSDTKALERHAALLADATAVAAAAQTRDETDARVLADQNLARAEVVHTKSGSKNALQHRKHAARAVGESHNPTELFSRRSAMSAAAIASGAITPSNSSGSDHSRRDAQRRKQLEMKEVDLNLCRAYQLSSGCSKGSGCQQRHECAECDAPGHGAWECGGGRDVDPIGEQAAMAARMKDAAAKQAAKIERQQQNTRIAAAKSRAFAQWKRGPKKSSG